MAAQRVDMKAFLMAVQMAATMAAHWVEPMVGSRAVSTAASSVLH